MLPIKLTIEGLYSYKEKQVINFESLTSSWLFGIFGKVGSGKSSVIDAITLSVYGEVERLNQRDNKNYNLMNLDSSELFIEFICKVKQKQYSFIYQSKKTKKGDKVNTPERKISVLEDDTWVTIDKTGEEILNISYRNFKQAVVIPQGKFQEFISQAPKDRTEMLSEIFNLKKYDLSSKVKTLKDKSNSEKDRIEGALQGIPNVNEEDLETKKIEIETGKKTITKIKENINKLEEIKTKISNAKEIFLDYNNTSEKLEINKKLKESLSDIEEKIYLHENIKPLLIDKKNISDKLDKNTEDLNNLKNKKRNNELELLDVNEVLNDLSIKESDIKNKEVFKQDFNSIIHINKLEKDLNQISHERIKYEMDLIESKKILTEIESNKLHLENKKEALDKNLNNSDLILDLSQWHIKNDNLLSNLVELNIKKDNLSLEIKKLETELELLNNKLSDSDIDQNLSLRSLLEEKIDELKLNEKLSDFTASINDGKACPLCGSTEHPKVLKLDNIHNKLEVNETQLSRINALIKDTEKLNSETVIVKAQLNNKKSDLKEIENKASILNVEISVLKNKFKWSEIYINKAELEKLKEESSLIKDEINKIDNDIKLYSRKRDEIHSKIQKTEITMNEFKVSSEFKINEKNKLTKSLLKLNFEDYLDSSDEDILNYIKNYDREILAYNLKLNENKDLKNNLEQDIKIIQSQKPRIIESIDELSSELFLKEEKLQKVKNSINLVSIDEELLLKEGFDLRANKENVEKIKKEYDYLKTRITELLEKKSKNTYFEHEDEDNKISLRNKKESLEELNKNIASLEAELRVDLDNLEKNKKSNEERNRIIKRYDNLVTLEKLFKGKKFVQYVADFYLKNLIHNANKRFTKLTKHQLSIDIDDKSNFIVKDNLNGGRIRLLKTLSGGQTFQASFCIALALAESINILNKQDENFFFIDEGFGSLDKDSLRLVFNTLNSLRYEKRIVGVISHVEDFKREVDVSITIKRDKKSGSIVKTSW